MPTRASRKANIPTLPKAVLATDRIDDSSNSMFVKRDQRNSLVFSHWGKFPHQPATGEREASPSGYGGLERLGRKVLLLP